MKFECNECEYVCECESSARKHVTETGHNITEYRSIADTSYEEGEKLMRMLENELP